MTQRAEYWPAVLTRRKSRATLAQPPLTPAVFHVLLALAEGPLHGYAIMQPVEASVSSRNEPEVVVYRVLLRPVGFEDPERLIDEGRGVAGGVWLCRLTPAA